MYNIFEGKTPKLFVEYECPVNILDKIELSTSVVEEKQEDRIKPYIEKPPQKKPAEEEEKLELVRSAVKDQMYSLMDSIIGKMREENDDKRIRWEKNLFKDSVHLGIKCQLCEMEPIVGIWYKSATRPDYNLCLDCESKLGYDDVFLKIKRSEDYEKFLNDIKKIPGIEGAALLNRFS